LIYINGLLCLYGRLTGSYEIIIRSNIERVYSFAGKFARLFVFIFRLKNCLQKIRRKSKKFSKIIFYVFINIGRYEQMNIPTYEHMNISTYSHSYMAA